LGSLDSLTVNKRSNSMLGQKGQDQRKNGVVDTSKLECRAPRRSFKRTVVCLLTKIRVTGSASIEQKRSTPREKKKAWRQKSTYSIES